MGWRTFLPGPQESRLEAVLPICPRHKQQSTHTSMRRKPAVHDGAHVRWAKTAVFLAILGRNSRSARLPPRAKSVGGYRPGSAGDAAALGESCRFPCVSGKKQPFGKAAAAREAGRRISAGRRGRVTVAGHFKTAWHTNTAKSLREACQSHDFGERMSSPRRPGQKA